MTKRQWIKEVGGTWKGAQLRGSMQLHMRRVPYREFLFHHAINCASCADDRHFYFKLYFRA